MNNFIVNSISYNQDNVSYNLFYIQSLLCVACNYGYRLYETSNFEMLNDVDDYTLLLVKINSI